MRSGISTDARKGPGDQADPHGSQNFQAQEPEDLPLPQNSNEVLGILTVVIKGQTKTQVEQARLQDEVAKTYNEHIGKLMWLLIDLHHHHW